ncbi:MAG: MerR family transcriptional regulator [Deltaproteobacteria bacterium]|nr:MerR family transcriptional regulator [Deltaproteobacteria bacterium]
MDAYDSKTASRIVGVSLRQIQYWDERGFVRPSVRLAGGRGTKRLYSFHDLICLKVVKDLAGYGFSLQRIRRCLQPLRKADGRAIEVTHGSRYLTNGEDLFMITSDREKILGAMERQFVLSLGIGHLVQELSGAVARAALPARRRRALLNGAGEKFSGRA